MSDIRRIPVADLLDYPGFWAITKKYAEESSIEGMGRCNYDGAQYLALEQAGALHAIGAYDDHALIGFAVFLVTVIPHYGVRAATTESVFVSQQHRKGRLGLRLIREMEAWAKELGAVGIFLSSPVDGRLSKLAPRIGYRHTNQVFFKGLKREPDSDT